MTDYSKMSDFEINKAVAITFGHQCYYGDGSYTNGLMGSAVVVKGNGVVGSMDFCNSWADAGPIAQKGKISLYIAEDGCMAYSVQEGVIRGKCYDDNPCRAICIVFLMMNEGE